MFWNMNCIDTEQIANWCGQWTGNKVLINVGLKVRKHIPINYENVIDAIVSNSKTRAT